MIFDQFFKPKTHHLQIGSRSVLLKFVHHPRARRYLLRLRQDGVAKITIPRNGTTAFARTFAEKNIDWLERQIQKLAEKTKIAAEWKVGSEIHFRGELVKIEVECGKLRFGSERIKIPDSDDFKPAIQTHLWNLAHRELPVRVLELAQIHNIEVTRVSVRNQKTRWGSCSRNGTISLNWRLIQAPDFVRDYVVLHEIAHRKHMNHS